MNDQQKKLVVSQETCIGCGTCIALCPEVFMFNDDGKSVVKDQSACANCDCQAAVDACQVNAISWVDSNEKSAE